jgi:hypothetical protein
MKSLYSIYSASCKAGIKWLIAVVSHRKNNNNTIFIDSLRKRTRDAYPKGIISDSYLYTTLTSKRTPSS